MELMYPSFNLNGTLDLLDMTRVRHRHSSSVLVSVLVPMCRSLGDGKKANAERLPA